MLIPRLQRYGNRGPTMDPGPASWSRLSREAARTNLPVRGSYEIVAQSPEIPATAGVSSAAGSRRRNRAPALDAICQL